MWKITDYVKLEYIFILLVGISCTSEKTNESHPPNILILHTDQWRVQSLGYMGNPDVKTPNIDRLASESANCTLAVSGLPVCSPHRATLLTGQRPLTHGIFMNDVPLDTQVVTLAEILGDQGYRTGYIGKWHLDGRGRSNFTPPGGRRQGFDYWKALECSHDYNQSAYYFGSNRMKQFWNGYDTFSQTDDAIQFISDQSSSNTPFLLMLAWGTPHAPYHTAPQEYRDLYHPDSLYLRPNVPEEMEDRVRKDLAGYYAHCTALDDMVGKILHTLDSLDIADETLIVFTSDHGDLLGSQGAYKKQRPFDESIRVPMLFRHPEIEQGRYPALINSEDILPTLLGISQMEIPDFVEGIDYSTYFRNPSFSIDTTTLISCIQPFGQWNRPQHGGKEYRGLRSLRYTYVKDLEGPWLLFDNVADPFQQYNLVDSLPYKDIQESLDQQLTQKLQAYGDEFNYGLDYVAEYGYPPLDDRETVPYNQ